MLDALGANNRGSMALAADDGLNIFFFHFDQALGSNGGCAMVAGDAYKLAAFQSSAEFTPYSLVAGAAKIATIGVAPYVAHIGHGLALHHIVTSKGACLLSTDRDLVTVQANRPTFPRISYRALRLIAVPYVHFEGACLHYLGVKLLASAIVAGNGLFQLGRICDRLSLALKLLDRLLGVVHYFLAARTGFL